MSIDRSNHGNSKPFQTSTTFSNLQRNSRGVFHILDDGLLLVESVLGISNQSGREPQSTYHEQIGWVLSGASRAYPLEVTRWDVGQPRTVAWCIVGKPPEIRPFWGWNRATHSLLELAVLWSRRDLLELATLKEEFQRHRVIIEKTAGDRELEALWLLDQHFQVRFEQTQSS